MPESKPVELTFGEILNGAAEQLHRARHLTVSFADGDDLPGIDMGWGAGAMFGIHFALTYPRLAAKINRALFNSQPDRPGPNLAVDIVAQVLTDQFFPLDASDDTMLDKLNQLKDKFVVETDR